MHMKAIKRHLDSRTNSLVDIVEIDRIQLQRSPDYRDFLKEFLRRDLLLDIKFHDGLFNVWITECGREYLVSESILIRDFRKKIVTSNVDAQFLGRYRPVYVDPKSSFPNNVGSFIRIFSVDSKTLDEPIDAMVIPPSNFSNYTYPEVRTVDQSEFMGSGKSIVQLDRITSWKEVHLG